MAKVLSYSEQDVTAINIKTSDLIRGLDLIASGLGLLLLSPVFLIIGLVIKLTSAGPVFYKAERVGQGGRLFILYKFRSMYLNADRNGPRITLKDDPRITPVGRFLRRTKLDEFPQLINVFRGEMSLVGPRPEDPRYVALYTPMQRQVLAVRPGMTSPASLHYREEETFLSGDNWEAVYREQVLPAKLALDLAYLQQRTLWTDLALILQTITVLINGKKRLNLILNLRNRHFFMLDLFALLFTPALALTLHLDRLDWWPRTGQALILFTLVALLVKLPIFYKLNLYNCYWRYAGVSELTLVPTAVFLSTTVLTALFIGAHATLERYDLAMYRCVPLIDGLLTCLTVSGFRFGMRGLYHWCHQRQSVVGGRRVLAVGAGEAGAMVAREMRANPQLDMEPVAFVDDDPAKVGMHIQGLPVLGTCAQIPELVDRYQIQQMIVAMPSASFGRQREIITMCEQTGVATYNLPGIYELLAGHKTISRLPQIDINLLLHREPVEIDQTEVAAHMVGATVLVTGAGGSIGSELCRQIARFNPAELILLGRGENSIFEIALDLRLSFPDLVMQPVIMDVRDQQRVNWVVKKHRPNVIFHAAAHKHVPFMEANVEEAITNNVLGTQNVLRAAEQYGVERFILISTDKAVNPTSVMGATKRLAELLVVAAARRSGQAYMAVRFGNVLGSRGSVIPVFQRQIAAGGPLTITHPDMRRYFITIPEAIQLVLQASELGHGGEIFVLDMGEPVRILDLATDLIKLSGLKPGRDIKIIYTGLRPGEKLSEELFLECEDCQRTKHPKVFVATYESAVEAEMLEQMVIELVNLTRQMQSQNATDQMQVLLPEVCYYIDKYKPVRSQVASTPDRYPALIEPRLEGGPPMFKPISA
jgi:FlaA1/EpsC-like NDP-sugar epimerase/lipopolysaccharide/colanic/teichoic acid biosynthesis glycosyltransferase